MNHTFFGAEIPLSLKIFIKKKKKKQKTFPEFKVVLKYWESVDDTNLTNLLKGYGDLGFFGIEEKNVISYMCEVCTSWAIETETGH